jgi:hypothetical protein
LESELVSRVMVEVVEEKNGKVREKEMEIDDLRGAARFINVYKPSTGWELLEIKIRPVLGLV